MEPVRSASSGTIDHRSLSRLAPSRRLAAEQPLWPPGQVSRELPIAMTATLPSVANLAGAPDGRTPVADLAAVRIRPALIRTAGAAPSPAPAATWTRRNSTVLPPASRGPRTHRAPSGTARHVHPAAAPSG